MAQVGGAEVYNFLQKDFFFSGTGRQKLRRRELNSEPGITEGQAEGRVPGEFPVINVVTHRLPLEASLAPALQERQATVGNAKNCISRARAESEYKGKINRL